MRDSLEARRASADSAVLNGTVSSIAVDQGSAEQRGPSPQFTPAEGPATFLSALEIAWLCWAKRRWLARVALWGLALSTVVAFSIPKRYRATIRLMPPDYHTGSSLAAAVPAIAQAGGGAAAGGNASTAMSVANQLLGLNTSGDLIAGIVRSQTVEDRIIGRFHLMDLYGERYAEDARKQLEKRSEIEIDKKTGIISISVEDHLPSRASAMAQSYVDELNALLSSVNTSAAHRERVFIEGRLDEVTKEQTAAEKEFSQFSSQNSAIDIPQQAKAMVEGAAKLQAELTTAQTRLAGLEQIYAPQNVRVRELRAQVSELQRQLEKLNGKGIDISTGSTLSSDELYPSLRQIPLLGVKYLDLYRRNLVNESVFELLTKQVEIARIEEAKDIPSVKILDPPELPEKKSYPHRLWIMLCGMAGSVICGTALLVGREMWARFDADSPWKILLREVFMSAKSCTWDSRAGKKVRRWAAGVGGRGREPADDRHTPIE